MSNPDRSIDPRILSSAKKVFLAQGFRNASLKEICVGAHITTGALYKRYRGKEALFHAVVADTVAALEDFIEQKSAADESTLTDDALRKAWDMNETIVLEYFRFLYAHYEGFVLLLKCAAGTAYSDFQHDWVEIMTGKSYAYFWKHRNADLPTQTFLLRKCISCSPHSGRRFTNRLSTATRGIKWRPTANSSAACLTGGESWGFSAHTNPLRWRGFCLAHG